jgi:hypothetical protein
MMSGGDKMVGLVGQTMGGPRQPITPLAMQAETIVAVRIGGIAAPDVIETLNRFFYMTKADGVTFGPGKTVTDLYIPGIFDSAGGAVANLVDSSKQATCTGVFTARKGFSLTSSGALSIPFDTSTLDHIFAGIVDPSAIPVGQFNIMAPAGSAVGVRQALCTTTDSSNNGMGWRMGGNANYTGYAYGASGVSVSGGGEMTPAGRSGNLNGGAGTNASSPTTTTGLNPTMLTRWSAYACANSSWTATQQRKFLSRLLNLLDDIGALQ